MIRKFYDTFYESGGGESNPVDKEAILKKHTYSTILPTTKWLHEAMDEYAESYSTELRKENEELKKKCESDHLSIDELLSEFNRSGFNTENWDGDEGAERAIVNGVCTALQSKLEGTEEIARARGEAINELQSSNEAKDKEIEKLERTISLMEKRHIDPEAY